MDNSRHKTGGEGVEKEGDGAERAAKEATNAATEGEKAEEEGAGAEEAANEDEGEHEARQIVVLMCAGTIDILVYA